uniref:Uncharacterized protein n=1 Tax=Arundo donax TaxID=35708 RepID=A0A0A9BU87_ARUDO
MRSISLNKRRVKTCQLALGSGASIRQNGFEASCLGCDTFPVEHSGDHGDAFEIWEAELHHRTSICGIDAANGNHRQL